MTTLTIYETTTTSIGGATMDEALYRLSLETPSMPIKYIAQTSGRSTIWLAKRAIYSVCRERLLTSDFEHAQGVMNAAKTMSGAEYSMEFEVT